MHRQTQDRIKGEHDKLLLEVLNQLFVTLISLI